MNVFININFFAEELTFVFLNFVFHNYLVDTDILVSFNELFEVKYFSLTYQERSFCVYNF